MENQTRCAKWSDIIDLPDLIVLGVTMVLAVVTFLTTKLNPLYVPANDSLSNFPIPSRETVPGVFLFIILFVVSEVTFISFYFLGKKFNKIFRPFNVFAATWNLLTSQIAVQLLTEVIKSYVGRARPDMYSRCGYNAQYSTCKETGYVLSDSFKSFPSGHASGSMSSLYFCSVFLLKVVSNDSIFVSLAALLYILLALYIGSTRIRDFRHHVDDVAAGFFIGYLITNLIWKNAKKRIFTESSNEQTQESLQSNLIEQV